MLRTEIKKKLFCYLQLMRFPNLFTAIADVLAGYFIVAGFAMEWQTLAGLLLASLSIYAAGCVLNDLCDKDHDSETRPDRPLPSGRISARSARILTFVLFGIGLTGALIAGRNAFLVALLLTALVILYDSRVKERKVLGPLSMASCRATNLMLGMSPALALPLFIFPAITFGYVYSLTRLSRYEEGSRLGFGAWNIFAGWFFVIPSVFALWVTGIVGEDSLLFLSIFAIATGPALIAGLLYPIPFAIGQAVKALIIGIPLLDAVYAAGREGLLFGIPVALCALITFILSRRFYVT